jgi:hypothetical protein
MLDNLPTTGTPAPPDHTLVIEALDSGFFSNFNCVVNHLHHSLNSDGCRAIRVDWRGNPDFSEFAYGRPEDGNLWERFFEPLTFPNAPLTEIRTNTYADASMTGGQAFWMYMTGNQWRDAYHRVFAKHVRVRDEIASHVEEIANERLNGAFCVGVHFRHPANDEGPRPAPGFFEYARLAQRLLPRGRESRVVLATDVQECADHFKEVFGTRLVSQADISRVPLAGKELHPVHARANPRVSLGVEVLVDALLLSRCAVVIHATSNIATAVGYMSPDTRMLFGEPIATAALHIWSAATW